jgi:two-component system sensor histidine kinase/response regulator
MTEARAEERGRTPPVRPGIIVVIDDDYAMRLSCAKILTKSGFTVETFEDGARGLEGVARLKPDLVVVDLKMPGLSGMEVIPRVHEIDPQIVIVVITGYATIGTAVDAMKSGAYDFLPKPFSPDELRLIVDRGLERRHLQQESQRHEMERELLRRQFVTFVSHQLQSPLAAIRQYLDALRRMGDSPEAAAKRREWFDRCILRTDDMLQLTQDWLTISKLDRGCLAREKSRVDVARLVTGIMKTYEEMAATEGVALVDELAGAELPVLGDETCLGVLFDNLVVNAIKYNRRGGSVTASARTQGGEIVVSIADTGIGIPEKDLPYLFDEFFRVKGEGGKKTSGTGLGLPICRKISAEMGGGIEVESRPGEGSTFRVHLPAHGEP